MSDDGPDSEPTFACSICPKRYKRRVHLRRHVATHTSDRPFLCPWCGSSFQRADVLKRHAQTCQSCEVRGALPSQSRRRACDFCMKQKKACTEGQPCENCRRKSVRCTFTYRRDSNVDESQDKESKLDVEASGTSISSGSPDVSQPPDPLMFPAFPIYENPSYSAMGAYTLVSDIFGSESTNNTHWANVLDVATESLEDTTLPKPPNRYSFDFLYNFTSRTGLLVSFDCATENLRIQVLTAILQAQAAPEHMIEAADPADLATASATFTQTPILQDPLILKTYEILLGVKEVVTMKPRNSPVTLKWSPALEQQCLQFFSPSNIRKFLGIYWEVWHPNVNFIHRFSFDPANSKYGLVASMALIGASISPDPTDNEQARLWYNCIEEIAFTDDDFCCETRSNAETAPWIPSFNTRKIQALQAAYIVCVYQNWEGTDSSKRRVRRYRFATVVSVARDIGMMSARHLGYDPLNMYNFDWKDYIAREELIRTFLWIFLFDHAFVIFNNLPPRLVIREMLMHMAWPEACFQAPTAGECAQEIQKWIQRFALTKNITVRGAVEMFCKDAMMPEMYIHIADLGPLNLFAILLAFHSLLFLQQNSFVTEDCRIVRLALANWQLVWETYTDQLSTSPPHTMVLPKDFIPGENMWKRVGFMRYAPEFWLLTNVVVNRIIAANQLPPSLNQAAAGSTESTDPILRKYDQTSMRQVNELITEFQKVQIT